MKTVKPVHEEKKTKYPVTAVSGSMKFYNDILAVGKVLEESGQIPLLPMRVDGDIDYGMLTAMHHQRIDMADSLFVVNPGNYIGISTQEEIDYAITVGKPVKYLVEPDEIKIVTLIGSRKYLQQFREVEATLSKGGILVFSPSIFAFNDTDTLTVGEHAILDELHMKKMKMSSKIIVIDPDDYIGKDTKEEIQWVLDNGIPIDYYSVMKREGKL